MEKDLNAQITEYLKNKDFDSLRKLLKLPEDFVEQLKDSINSEGKFSFPDILKKLLMSRDKIQLDLKEVEESDLSAQDLQLEPEVPMNNHFRNTKGEIHVVKGTDTLGKRHVLYYHTLLGTGIYIDHRTYNTNGDVDSQIVDTIGTEEDNIFRKYSEGCKTVVLYEYDDNGNKKAAISCGKKFKPHYYSYDNGNIVLAVESSSEGAVLQQTIRINGQDYKLYDGAFEKKVNPINYVKTVGKSVESLKTSDIRRYSDGPITDDGNIERIYRVLRILNVARVVLEDFETDFNEKGCEYAQSKIPIASKLIIPFINALNEYEPKTAGEDEYEKYNQFMDKEYTNDDKIRPIEEICSQYDSNGKIVAAIYRDQNGQMRYCEYDEEGNILAVIESSDDRRLLTQKIKISGSEFTIYDGDIKTTDIKRRDFTDAYQKDQIATLTWGKMRRCVESEKGPIVENASGYDKGYADIIFRGLCVAPDYLKGNGVLGVLSSVYAAFEELKMDFSKDPEYAKIKAKKVIPVIMSFTSILNNELRFKKKC